jgi:hypothetical protein
MTTMLKIFVNSIAGFALGAAVLFLGLVAAVGFAFATEGRVFLPGVLTAWFTTENDLPALNFEPNLFGMLAVILVITALYVFAAFQIGKRVKARRNLNV